MGKLNRTEITDLLEQPIVSIICTLNPDGTPHMTPVWHLMDRDEIVVAVEETSVKARNTRNDSRVALCVTADEKPQRWLLLNGTATLTKDAVDELVRSVSVHYMGAQEGKPYAQEVLRDLDFVLIRIRPTSMLGFDGLD